VTRGQSCRRLNTPGGTHVCDAAVERLLETLARHVRLVRRIVGGPAAPSTAPAGACAPAKLELDEQLAHLRLIVPPCGALTAETGETDDQLGTFGPSAGSSVIDRRRQQQDALRMRDVR
jgi:hypothetical protein